MTNFGEPVKMGNGKIKGSTNQMNLVQALFLKHTSTAQAG